MSIPAAPATTTLAALRAEPLLALSEGLGVGAVPVEEALVPGTLLVARLELLKELLVMVPLALLLETAAREKEAVGVAMVVVLKAVAVETRCMVMVLVMVMVDVAVLVSAAANKGRSATLRTEDSCILDDLVVVVRRR